MSDDFDLLVALNGPAIETKERAGDSETPELVVTRVDTEKKEIELAPVADDDPKAECLRQITNILSIHGGLESNIPITHEYWKLTNKYWTM